MSIPILITFYASVMTPIIYMVYRLDKYERLRQHTIEIRLNRCEEMLRERIIFRDEMLENGTGDEK